MPDPRDPRPPAEAERALAAARERLAAHFAGLPAAPGSGEPGGGAADPLALPAGAFERALLEAANRLRDNYPYFHPLYAGQMLKPPHPVAAAAYALALGLNPNNHALDGGRASSAMEKEAVAALAAMFGWRGALGHLTGGGTIANLEALWIAGRERPGTILASSQAHYTHARLCDVLALPFEAVPCDARGRMDTEALAARLARGGVGSVVATLGTPGVGAVDPLPGILALRARHAFRLHVDAAYGGYFTLAANLSLEAREAFDRIGEADSIVVDPHKHGLQPYGCGCVLLRDAAVGRHYLHDSPYTYFTSGGLHLGEISLECSRPGAAAVALWTTMRALPLERGGAFARGLEAGREAALALHAWLAADPRFLTAGPPQLDIVAWTLRAPGAAAASALARRTFEQAAARDLHLALAELPRALLDAGGGMLAADQDSVTCLRSVLMKPEHRSWLPEIQARLSAAADAALAAG